MPDWANHSPRTGEDSDRFYRHFTMIMAAFRFGFLSHVVRGPDDYWNPQALRSVLGVFATELKTPGFAVLKSALADLEAEASALFEATEAIDLLDSLGVAWSRDNPPTSRDLRPLAGRLLQWVDDTTRFGDTARNAVIESSLYRVWFSCGRWLGDCMKQSHAAREREENGLIQLSIHYLQESVGSLPPDFLEAFYWLTNFRDFDFRAASPVDWFRQVPLGDGIAAGETDAIPDDSANTLGPYGADYGPAVTDYQSFFDYFYARFNRDLGLLHFLLVSGFDMAPGTAPSNSMAGKQQVNTAEREESKVSADDKNAKPPAIKGEAAGAAEVKPHQTPEPKLKAPDDKMFAAYRLKVVAGIKTQKEIAAMLSKEYRKKIHQGTVSVWLDRVEKWIEAGNVMPKLPGLDGEPPSIDPRVIGMGARQDGLTPRQRAKRKEMDDNK